MTAPILTERLILRPASKSDRADLVALERNPEFMRFINGGRPIPEEGVDAEAGFLAPRGGERGIWTAIEREPSAFAGWFSLRPCERVAELGYRLRRTAWGRGLGSEGARAIVDWGFGGAGLEAIVATAMAVNWASRRVMEKAGLRYVRTVHINWPEPLPGNEMGDVEYEITRDAWVASRR